MTALVPFHNSKLDIINPKCFKKLQSKNFLNSLWVLMVIIQFIVIKKNMENHFNALGSARSVILSAVYPIGSIYVSASSVNPN